MGFVVFVVAIQDLHKHACEIEMLTKYMINDCLSNNLFFFVDVDNLKSVAIK